MKTATLPSLRVEPEVREKLESILTEGETVSAFIEMSVRESIRRRQLRAEFLKRGMDALARFENDGVSASTEEVLGRLEAKLEAAKAIKAKQQRK